MITAVLFVLYALLKIYSILLSGLEGEINMSDHPDAVNQPNNSSNVCISFA